MEVATKAVINIDIKIFTNKNLLEEYSCYKVLKQLKILNSKLVIDIGGGDNQCFVYTGSGCSHVLCRLLITA